MDNNDETVRFYTVDGKQLGAAKAINGTASQAVSESFVIAKMGNQTILYLYRIHAVTFLPFRAYNTDNQLIIHSPYERCKRE